ncbi:MAG TPA: patatin-like phospholipase family protein [Gemmatimonadales bacterium]|nr:patatin-like phospholipase family protein [Gemmatimonadales bacterium]
MRVVAVLSGGGAKSLAHAGAFRALEQAGLIPDHIVATSMGAVIGAALASGVAFEDVRRRSLGLRRKDVAPFDLLAMLTGVFARALIPRRALQRTIAHLVPARRFEHLRIPMTVTATDLDSGELVLLRDTVPLQDALYASCALPLYFPPLELNGRRLADGGLRAVLPLGPARSIPADVVVAIDVGPGFDEVRPPGPPAAIPALIRAHGEAIRIMMAAQAERALRDWPKDGPRLVYVRPVAEREATFAVEHLERYVEAGYSATQRALA